MNAIAHMAAALAGTPQRAASAHNQTGRVMVHVLSDEPEHAEPAPAAPVAAAAQRIDASGSTTSRLLAALEDGPMRTGALADACGLTTRQVWGLLKQSREVGRVAFADGLWTLDVDFPGSDIARAAALLRRNGWRVEPPEGSA